MNPESDRMSLANLMNRVVDEVTSKQERRKLAFGLSHMSVQNEKSMKCSCMNCLPYVEILCTERLANAETVLSNVLRLKGRPPLLS